MMKKSDKYIFDLEGVIQVEQRDDRWAARMVDFLGVTVYGQTKDEALDRVDAAIKFFTDNYMGDGKGSIERFRTYLDEHGVRHTLSIEYNHDDLQPLYRGRSRRERRSMRVAVGA